MAVPCCPKCSKTHFVRQNNPTLNVALIYCGGCGAVVGAAQFKLTLKKSSGGTSGSTSGKTASDDWTAVA